MVKLNKIYTRTGDEGKTGLVGGHRVAKHSLRVEAYGTVDEANGIIGLAMHACGQDQPEGWKEMEASLRRIQHDLFDLGADLAAPDTPKEGEALRIIGSQVQRLEKEIDVYNEHLEPLNSFVLPGGSLTASYLHQARTVVRRAERLVAALYEQDPINPLTLAYLNRLSDHLFVLARVANGNGAKDVLWQPGVNR